MRLRSSAGSAFIVLALIFFGFGCAHLSPRRDADPNAAVAVAPSKTPSARPVDPLLAGSSMSSVGPVTLLGVPLQHTEFDYPIAINAGVEKWATYFTGRGRKVFEKFLARGEVFIPYILPILREHGLPQDLVYLAMIESGFSNHARSFAAAVGPWQFIPATGRRYGLMVNWWVDERRDIQKSTVAAARYLKDLFEMYRSWELAAASYNAGETKIGKAIRKYGTNDFWALTVRKNRYLKPETKDYVPKIMAAALLAKNRTQFGFPERYLNVHAGEVISADGEVVPLIQKAIDPKEPDPRLSGEIIASADEPTSREKTLEELLHELEADIDEATAGSTVTEAEVDNTPLAMPVNMPHVNKKGELGTEAITEVEVQSPADLLKIARASGLSYQTVKGLNPEVTRWCTPPQMKTYRIKLPSSVTEKFLMTYNHPAFPRQTEFMSYLVRKGGDTPRSVAKRFGLRPDPVAELNQLSLSASIQKGFEVLLPIPADTTESLASLDLLDPPERRKRKRAKRRRVRPIVSLKKRQTAQARTVTGGI